MARADWIGDELAAFNIPYKGWQNPYDEGEGFNAIAAIVIHDTVTTDGWDVARVCDLIEEGRSDLPGPLYNVGIDRSPLAHWIADGSANHNGYGRFGNESLAVAFYTAGGLNDHEEPASADQQDLAAQVCAAMCLYLGLPASRVLGHKETDPGRKVDPYGVNMDDFRAQVQSYMDNPKPEEDDDMRVIEYVETEKHAYLIDHPYRIRLDPEAAEYFRNLAKSTENPRYKGPYQWDEKRVQYHPEVV